MAQEELAGHHVETVHFPPYSPELNPQKHVWKQGLSAVAHNRFIAKIGPMTKELVDYLNRSTFTYSLSDFRNKSKC